MLNKLHQAIAHSPQLGATSWLIEFRGSDREAREIRGHLQEPGFDVRFGRGRVYRTINVLNVDDGNERELMNRLHDKFVSVTVFDHQSDGRVHIRIGDQGQFIRATLLEYQDIRRRMEARFNAESGRVSNAA